MIDARFATHLRTRAAAAAKETMRPCSAFRFNSNDLIISSKLSMLANVGGYIGSILARDDP
jgi:hypothetical protein